MRVPASALAASFVALTGLGAALGALLLFPAVLTILVHSRRVIGLRHRYIAHINGQLLQILAVAYCLVSGTKVFLYVPPTPGRSAAMERVKDNENALIVCNHRTNIDWMFSGWLYSTVVRINSSVKFSLKDSLRSVPLFGWAMQLAMCVFLSRNRALDLPHMQKMLLYILNSTQNLRLIIFPEGTTLSESNKARSKQYAQDKGLRSYEYVLHPKAQGFVACMEILRRSDNATFVHDITIAYVDHSPGRRSSGKALLFGRFPREVHLFVSRIGAEAFPTDPVAVGESLSQMFGRKEDLLTRFYEQQYRPGPGDSDWALAYTQKDFLREFTLAPLLVWALSLGLLYWWFEWFRWLCILIIGTYVAVSGFSGLDLLELTLHGNMVLAEGAIK